jgi:hypothetical protein
MTIPQPNDGTAGAFASAAANDIDGDGFIDLIVGRIGAATDPGRLYVYRGGAGGFATPTTIDPPSGDTSLGAAVSAGRDLDGDGYGDVFVEWTDGGGTAHRSPYHGSATGLAGTPNAADAAGEVAATDINADGYTDLLQRVSTIQGGVFYGRTTGLPSAPDTTFGYFAPEVLTGFATCDFDGDGFPDEVNGGTDTAQMVKLIDSFFGRAGFTITSSASGMTTDPPAGPISCADFNRDGYADLTILLVAHGSGRRSLVPYWGSMSIPRPAAAPIDPLDTVDPTDCASIGDINNDGYGDLAVSTPGGTTEFHVFYGNSTGFGASMTLTEPSMFTLVQVVPSR